MRNFSLCAHACIFFLIIYPILFSQTLIYVKKMPVGLPLKRSHPDSEDDDSETSDGSWVPSSSDNSTPPAREIHTRSRGPVQVPQPPVGETIVCVSDGESTTESSDCEEIDTEDDEYSDDDSFVESEEEDSDSEKENVFP